MTLSANPVDKVTEQPVNGALLDRTMFMCRLLVSSREAQWIAALQKILTAYFYTGSLKTAGAENIGDWLRTIMVFFFSVGCGRELVAGEVVWASTLPAVPSLPVFMPEA